MNTVIGNIYRIDETTSRQVGDKTYYSRQFSIIQRRFDEFTGEEKKANFIQFEVKGEKNAEALNAFTEGQKVVISYVIEGSEYEKKDKNGNPTGEKAIFNRVNAVRIDNYTGRASQSFEADAPAAPAAPSAPAAPAAPTSTQKPKWASSPEESVEGEEDDLPFD